MNQDQRESLYGRLVPKPEKAEQQELIYEENVTVHDQIETLRTKISLKERYNKVQDEELEECRVGAKAITSDLWDETYKLRHQLVDALEAEKRAVHKALRSHRDFQLALADKVPSFAVAWLDDKVFDLSKRLNVILASLACKRLQLKESEDLVKLLEKYPRPGSTKWETETAEKCQYLEYAIENMKVKRETASILHARYHQIRLLLLDEKGHYAPTLKGLNNQLKSQKKELEQLTKMLGEAIVFQNEALRNLTITEMEASHNRRKRRHQMTKMKKAVQKILEDNMTRVTRNESRDLSGDDILTDQTAHLRMKKAKVERYKDKARRLVDCMRVPDLTHIPGRLRSVYELAERLKQDQKRKEENRNFLLHQRDQLLCIYNYLTYTRQNTEIDFTATQAGIQTATAELEEDIKETRKSIEKYGAITVDVRLGLISILELLNEGVSGKAQLKLADTLELLKFTNVRIVKFMKQLEELKQQVPVPLIPEDMNTFKAFVKTTPVPFRLIRVGTSDNDDDSDEDVYDEMSVPTNADIKAKNARVIAQAMLKKGIV